LGVMRRLREAVRQKRKDLWARGFCTMITHRRIVPSLCEFLTKNETNTIEFTCGSLQFFSVQSSQKIESKNRVIMDNSF